MIEITKTQLDYSSMMSGITWYVFGQPKTGKTTNLSKWSDIGSEGTLILDTDLGTDFLDEANVVPILGIYPPYEMVDDKKVLVPPNKRGFVYRNGPNQGKDMSVYSIGEIIQAMHTKIGLGFDTIVIDTVDKINEWAEAKVKADLGIDEIGNASYGAGWAKAKDMVVNVVSEFQNYVKKHGKTLVLVSHSKETQMTDGKVQLGPALPSGLAKKLVGMSDAIGYSTVDKETQKPVLSFEAYDERTIGSRIPTLHNKVFEFDYSTIKSAALEKPEEVKQIKTAPEVPSTNGAINNNHKQMEAMNG
tara:strand:+ start:3144 stop:4052 length:909 start_codon:yes stop_codon:yes gene_type:complete